MRAVSRQDRDPRSTARRRFVVEREPVPPDWDGRRDPHRAIVVALTPVDPAHPLAVGALGIAEGADEAAALLTLWTTLRADFADALACVADAYHARTGRHLRPWPPRPGGSSPARDAQ